MGMIYTLTTNPAIDYHMDLTETGLMPGQINRSAREEMYPGGKGINVSVVLSRLGIKNKAWGFVAGKTGTLLEALASVQGCDCDFILLPEGETRINVKLDCEQETAVNGKGPQIQDEQVADLLNRICRLSAEDTLILSGILQAGKADLYEEVARVCDEKGIRMVVDTEGDDLRKTFRYHPFLIKPNREELLKLFNCENDSVDSIVSMMRACQNEGVMNVLVTLGGEGALFLSSREKLYKVTINGEHRVISTVGAGDSTVAGFLAGLELFGDEYGNVLRLACAAGTATASKKWLCTKEEIEGVIQDIEVQKCEGKL